MNNETEAALEPELLMWRWNLNTTCNWEELTGRKVEDIDFESEKDMRMLIFCGLKDEIEGFTILDAGRLMNTKNKVVAGTFLAGVIAGKTLDEITQSGIEHDISAPAPRC